MFFRSLPQRFRFSSRRGLAIGLAVLALGPLGAIFMRLQPDHADRPMPDGFRQLGQTLVGTIETQDGNRLTLVLDAKTRAVIGSKLERAESAQGASTPPVNSASGN